MHKVPRIGVSLNRIASTATFVIISGFTLALTVPVVRAQADHTRDGMAASVSSVRAQLVGSWRLVSRVSRRENGEVEPDSGLSTLPMGVLIYDQSGHVAAQLSRRDRGVAMIGEECRAAAAITGTSDTAQTVLGYDAYFGTYTVDEKKSIVTHHLEAALWPGDVGKDIERHFAISGDRLTILFTTTTHDGVKVTRTLVWERMR